MALQPNLCQPRGPPPEKEERTNRGCAQKEAEMTGAAEGSPDVPCLCGPDPCCIRALVRSASTVLMAGVFRIFVYTPWNEGKPVTSVFLDVYGCLWDLSIEDSSQQRRPCSQQGRGVLTSFYYQGVKLSNGTFIFLLWSKRGKFKINMTDLEFPNNWAAKLL